MSCSVRVLTVVLGLVVMTLTATDAFTIGAFNIQIFGQSKVSKPEVVNVLVKILQRYDIVLIQEIRDSSGTAIQQLLQEVNTAGPNEYGMIISDRLGRTSSKEQYAYFYRLQSGITVLDSYQDGDVHDLFEREPYAGYFQTSRADIGKFALVGVHTSPDHVPEEIDALKTVLDDVYSHWGEQNILILGDLNADCNYFNNKEKEASALRTPGYYWLIPDEADTTVSATDCAYDRFIIDNELFARSVVEDSVKVFYFDREYGLTEEEAKAVSDHYPIELRLSGADRDIAAAPTTSQTSSGGFFDKLWDFISKARQHFEL